MQYFKPTDEKEMKFAGVFNDLMTAINSSQGDFYDGAYEAFPLGDVLYDLNKSPLANAISRGVFRSSYFAIFELFTRPATFEFYMDVFRAIFGDNVEVTFDVPANGCLTINVQVLDLSLDFLMAREIVSGAYVYHELITDEGDNIVAQVSMGPKTQSEIDAIMLELKAHGVYTVCNLVL